MWALEVLNCNYFLSSCANKGKLFSVMFHDSDIAKNFKTSYILYYGLAPHFKEILLDNLKVLPHFVPCYNKWYNSVIKKGQMDVLVRYWYVNLNKVSTCYISGQFMCKAAAEDALAKFESASSDL